MLQRTRPIVLSILSGISLGLIGVAIGLGKKAGVQPIEIMLVSTGVGSLVFAGKQLQRRQPAPIPLRVWWWGVTGGLSQYLAMRGIGLAMNLGPLSPVWCAASLGFIPVSFYSAIRYKERLTLLKNMALAAGVGCVVVSAVTNSRGGTTLVSLAGTLGYGAVLLAVLVLNSLNSIAIKTLGMNAGLTQPGQTSRANNLFLPIMYATCFLAALADLLWHRNPNLAFSSLVVFGGLAALGSMVGMALMASCASAPAGVVFTLSGISGVVTAALVSVLFLGERAGLGWGGTISLGVVSILFGALSFDSK